MVIELHQTIHRPIVDPHDRRLVHLVDTHIFEVLVPHQVVHPETVANMATDSPCVFIISLILLSQVCDEGHLLVLESMDQFLAIVSNYGKLGLKEQSSH